MEEKKFVKISLLTFFLFIILIAVIVIGLFIYKLNNNQTAEIQRLDELQAQVNSLKGVVNDLQKNITTISETPSINTSSINNSSDNTSLSEMDALTLLKSRFDILEKIYFDPFNFFGISHGGEEIIEFENIILKYGTENLLNEVKDNLPSLIRYESGKYNIYYGGGAPGNYNGFDKFENIKITNTKITATLKTKQNEIIHDGSNLVWQPTEDKSSEFVLVKNGENWLIDKFNSLDFN